MGRIEAIKGAPAGHSIKEKTMKSELKVRAEYELMPRPVYQVYRLKDKDKPDVRCNREVIRNCTTKEDAELIRKREEI